MRRTSALQANIRGSPTGPSHAPAGILRRYRYHSHMDAAHSIRTDVFLNRHFKVTMRTLGSPKDPRTTGFRETAIRREMW